MSFYWRTDPNDGASRGSKKVVALRNPVAALCLLALCIAAFACTGGTGKAQFGTPITTTIQLNDAIGNDGPAGWSSS